MARRPSTSGVFDSEGEVDAWVTVDVARRGAWRGARSATTGVNAAREADIFGFDGCVEYTERVEGSVWVTPTCCPHSVK
ncbi:hypothetical protein N9F40_00505 [bacterium]|nr:hypothetical protein [bacterium]